MSEQEFEAYLRLMGRFLHLSEAQRETIGRELRGHMEERLEDLIDRGFAREDAVNTILDEFGDAAALAGEFGRIGTRRKWIMRTTMGTVGIAAAVLLVSFLLPENRPVPGPAYSHAEQTPSVTAESTGMPQPNGSPRADGLLVGTRSENQAEKATREKLAGRIDIDFLEGTSFEEVLSFLRDAGEISIAVNWNALEPMGIDRTTDTLGMSIKNVRIDTALELVLENVGGLQASVGYTVIDGIVRITSMDQLDRDQVVRIYDVSDLIHRDLPAAVRQALEQAPRAIPGAMDAGGFGGGGGGAGGGGFGMMGGGGGFDGGFDGGRHTEAQAFVRRLEMERVNDLQQLIRTTVERGTWAPEGALGSLSYYEGLLVVVHTSRAHQELAGLLSVIREALAARPADGGPASAVGFLPMMGPATSQPARGMAGRLARP